MLTIAIFGNLLMNTIEMSHKTFANTASFPIHVVNRTKSSLPGKLVLNKNGSCRNWGSSCSSFCKLYHKSLSL